MNFTKVFKSFNQLKVLVVGDVMIDAYTWGKVERVSPEAPVPVLNWQREEHRLGGAANVALNLKALGVDVRLCAIVGKDDNGKLFKKLMRQENLSVKSIGQSASRQTTVKTRMIANGQQLLRVDQENTHELTKDENQKFINLILAKAKKDFKPDVVLFQDYNKGLLTKNVINEIQKWASQEEVPIVVDPKYKNFFSFTDCTLFKPNLKEVNAILGEKIEVNLKSLNRADKILRKQLNHQFTMITLSEKGVYISDGKNRKIIPTVPRKIADVCGAGDTVVSVAALGIALQLPLVEIGRLSNMAGGQVCEKTGVVSIDKQQLLEELLNEK
ncbi:MAG: bifunctional heptose 7-phosphate kinase/heptose 1-phosphate adenyltransferase [Saprospiraceae bacterium]